MTTVEIVQVQLYESDTVWKSNVACFYFNTDFHAFCISGTIWVVRANELTSDPPMHITIRMPGFPSYWSLCWPAATLGNRARTASLRSSGYTCVGLRKFEKFTCTSFSLISDSRLHTTLQQLYIEQLNPENAGVTVRISFLSHTGAEI